jgi:hypothetical protein
LQPASNEVGLDAERAIEQVVEMQSQFWTL